jgi:hypothetical protein
LLTTVTRTFDTGKVKVVKSFADVPQFCQTPSPGLRTNEGGSWSLRLPSGRRIGQAIPAPAADPPGEQTLCRQPPAHLLDRRDVQANVSIPEHAGTKALQPIAIPGRLGRFVPHKFEPQMVTNETGKALAKRDLLRRQAALGGYLSPKVYKHLNCDGYDVDPCDWGADCSPCLGGPSNCQSGEYLDYMMGEGGPSNGATTASASPTASPTVTVAPSPTAQPTQSPAPAPTSSNQPTAPTKPRPVYLLGSFADGILWRYSFDCSAYRENSCVDFVRALNTVCKSNSQLL